ncbi:protein phosphatase 2C domain-containing protein, partial [Streptobacillus moniliformis]|uniref:protein phosphatase 2C domain-containing protein n=1 Tax=Streptobacillus moniliformis TaxID=34105 RepID=UPI0018C8B7B7
MALWVADEPQRDAVLVVCDGVSSSEDSDVAALAAAERARDTLARSQPSGIGGVTASHDAAMVDALERAVADANRTVIEHTAAESVNAASCTFAAVVLHGSRIHW